ncbi:MAG: NADH-quinone oxidoreductase subunit NuoE [Candidatus Abyssobacteria bacterium SURF_17]|uniref:NADH-quinone oxidoreductase subunit NuoE n=1 Tax=Candidatus Abyssobacteria bacterium SURF_17 TaxID=2093361 RepID=A0A419EP86_9BACT|nr:MAG: NADH-quinone oxidoreductase subunit NuoE [Candidatus Abyssubacteria bacterium SURF_17]
MEEAIELIRSEFEGRPDELIPMLQRVQNAIGYLPEEALLEIARATRLPAARIFGVVTFYAQFRLRPVGKYIIRVCRGTACHVSGSALILQDIQNHLQVAPGQTTKDGLFTLETVACFGSCALAPVVVVNDSVYGLMDSLKTRKLIEEIREKHGAIVARAGVEKGDRNGLRIFEG